MEIITQQTLEDVKNYDSQKATLQYYLDYLGLYDIHDEGMKNEDVKQILKEMRTMGYECGEGQLRYTTWVMNQRMFHPLYTTDTQHPNDARYIVGITDDQAIVMHGQRSTLNDMYTYVIYPPKRGDTLLDTLSEVVKKEIARDSGIDKEDVDKINDIIVSEMENAILGTNTVGGKPSIGDIQNGDNLKLQRALYYDGGVVKQKLIGDIESGNKRLVFEVTGEERQREYRLKVTEQTKHKWLLGLETSSTNTMKFAHLEQAVNTINDKLRDELGLKVTPIDHTVENNSTTQPNNIVDIIEQNTMMDPYTYDVKQGTRRIYEEMLGLTEYSKNSKDTTYKMLAGSGGTEFKPLYTVEYQYYDHDIKGVIGKVRGRYHLIEETTPVTDIQYRLKYHDNTDLNYLLSRISGCDTEYVSQGYVEGLREQYKRVMESPSEKVAPNIAVGGQTEGITLHQSFRRQIQPTYISQHLSGQYSDGKKTMVVFADQQENDSYNVVIAVQDDKKRAQIQDEDKRQIKCDTIDDVDKSFAQGIGVRDDVEAIEYHEGISIYELVTHVAEVQKTLYGIEIPVRQTDNLDVDDIDWSFADDGLTR